MTNESSIDLQYRDGIWFAAIVAGGMGLAALLDDVLGYYFVWGGMDCETINGIYSCAGYSPAGLSFALLVSAAVVLGVRGRVR